MILICFATSRPAPSKEALYTFGLRGKLVKIQYIWIVEILIDSINKVRTILRLKSFVSISNYNLLIILRNKQLKLFDINFYMLPLQPDSSYHIFNHANGFENLFRCEGNYWYFLQKYQLYIEPIAETYAYCLMPNHFHLVIRIRKREVIEGLVANNFPKVSNFGKVIDDREIEKYLSKQFANLFSCYTQSFNKVYNRMGSLFIKNFKRELIADKTYFLTAVAYVHRNPIHHGFCRTYEEWPYSSYRQIMEGIKSDLRTESDKLMKMTLGLDEFIKLHQQSLQVILDDIIADNSTTA